MPAVMMTTSAPSRSAQFDVPRMFASYPRTAPFCTRSRALPLAKFSFAAISKRKTSPSSSFAQRRASSPPMLPAPIRPIFLRSGIEKPLSNHVSDDIVAELRTLDFGAAFHEAREIVRYALARDGAVHSSDDEVRGFSPAHVTKHHLAAEDDRAR